uniref:Uncharacterized protein n=1 Tax=Oryza brachyantha TaxID=4533 RepID=J3LCI0_ORYBR
SQDGNYSKNMPARRPDSTRVETIADAPIADAPAEAAAHDEEKSEIERTWLQ